MAVVDMKASTRTVVDGVDLNDVAGSDGYLFVRDGVGFAGRGIAARVDARECQSVLATIEHSNSTGLDVDPVAFGIMPFESTQPTELVIPKLVVGKNAEGHCWLTTVTVDSDRIEIDPMDELDALPVGPPTPTTASYSIRPVTSPDMYRSAVLAAREAVRHGDLVKAVIARSIEVESSEPFDVRAVLLRLRASFSRSYRYSFDGFIGASPELLLGVDGDVVTSHPLAGTAPRTGDPIVDEAAARQLLMSMKDQVEHRVVIDVIHDQLLPWCSYLDWEADPSIVQVANVQHLGTKIEGRLNRSRPQLLEMVRELCPTPALGGHPRKEALDLISRVEDHPRGRYGGAVGWVDGRGRGTWAVAIRCAELSIDRTRARLFAGGGIVAESNPDAELAETQAKFQAMLSALIRA